MPKQLISTETLEDISRHTNQIVRLAQFVSESKAKLVVDKTATLDENSDPFDLVTSLDADINLTVKMIKKLSLMMKSLDSDDRCTEFSADENDFKVLFPNHYNPEDKTLTVFGVKLNSIYDYSKMNNQEVKEELYCKIFSDVREDFDFKMYKKHLSTLKSMENNGAPTNSSTFDEALSYAMRKQSISKWRPFYSEVMKLVDKHHEIRLGFNDRSRSILDESIYSSRAMIYSVIKNSTYINKKEVVQLSSKHKGDDRLIHQVSELVSEIDCLRAVEIDPDASLLKFHDQLIELKKMNLDVPDAFELKVRKLGNYSFSGVYAQRGDANSPGLVFEPGFSSNKMQIIAFEADCPWVLPHEIAHFRDREQDDVRAKVVKHFGSKIDRQLLSEVIPKHVDYFCNDREIIARIGEIGFLLNDFGYENGQSVDEFAEKVRTASLTENETGEKINYNVRLNKPIDFYLAENNQINESIYFSFKDWTPFELELIRDYTHGFFYKNDPAINQQLKENLASGKLDSTTYTSPGKTRVVKRRKFTESEKVRALFGKIEPANLGEVYKVGMENGYFSPSEYLTELSANLRNVGFNGGVKGAMAKYYHGAVPILEGLNSLGDEINRIGEPVDKYIFSELLVKLGSSGLTFDENNPEWSFEKSDLISLSLGRASSSQLVVQKGESPEFDNFRDLDKRLSVRFHQVSKSPELTESLNNLKERFPNNGISLSDISPEQLISANESFKWRWLSNGFVNSLSSASDVTRNVESFVFSQNRGDVNLFMTMLSPEQEEVQVNQFAKSSFSDVLNTRTLMSMFSENETLIAKRMVDGGFLNKYSVDVENIRHLIADELLVNLDFSIPKEDLVKGYFDKLNAHSSRSALPGGSEVNSVLHSTVRYREVRGGAASGTDVAAKSMSISPISALVALASKSSPELWEDTRLEFTYELTKMISSTLAESTLKAGLVDHIKEAWNIRLEPLMSDNKLGGILRDVELQSSMLSSVVIQDLISSENSLSDEGVAIFSELLAADYVYLGEKSKPGAYFNLGYGRNIDRQKVYLCNGESFDGVTKFGASVLQASISTSLQDVRDLAMDINLGSVYKIEDTRNKVDSVFDNWLQDARKVSPELTASLLQGVASFTKSKMVSCFRDDLSSGVKNVILDIAKASSLAAVSISGKQSLYQDMSYIVSPSHSDSSLELGVKYENSMRKTFDEELAEVIEMEQESESTPTPEPEMPSEKDVEVEAIPESEPQKNDFEEINKDVPSANGGVLNPKNQLKMF